MGANEAAIPSDPVEHTEHDSDDAAVQKSNNRKTTDADFQTLEVFVTNPHTFFFFLTSTVGEKNQNREKEEDVLLVWISELMERERRRWIKDALN